jgi:uncharacterized protein YciI
MAKSTWRALGLLLASIPFVGAASLVRTDEAPRMTTVYLVLLEKGPAWTKDVTPASQATQEAHLARIRALWQEKKMIVAGPIEDGEDLRGIFVLSAASLDEAKALAASDPAVKAGRLQPVVYPWWVEKGVFPEAGSYCSTPKP